MEEELKVVKQNQNGEKPAVKTIKENKELIKTKTVIKNPAYGRH